MLKLMTQTEEKKVEEISKTLNISIPENNLPLPIRIISLLSALGGLSIVASILADIVSPQEMLLPFYILRLITGLLMLSIGYGMMKKREWSLWLYGGVSVVSFAINPVVALLPIGITIYLYHRRSFFSGGTPKELLKYWIERYNKLRG